MPITRDELTRRHAAYERGRWPFAILGAAPLVAVYVLIHTPWLKPHLPEARWLAVVILFFVPLGWLWALTRLYAAIGARRHGIACPGCGLAFLDAALRAVLRTGDCPRCGAPVVSDPASGTSAGTPPVAAP